MNNLALECYTKDDILLSCINPTELHLIVFVTEQCNFRCKYCYEDFEQGKMPQKTINSLLKLIKSRLNDLSNFTIDWFGGEPLLEYETIKLVNEKVLDFINSNNLKVGFCSTITTNGFLLSKTKFRDLYNLGNRNYQITLDGIEEVHNKSRVLKNGNKTFSKIWGNLLDIKNSNLDVNILLRIHLLIDNIDSIDLLLQMIESTFGDDKRFKCFLKPIANLGGCGSLYASNNIVPNQKELVENLKLKHKEILNFWSPNPICHATKFNSYIIRANGIINKCTTALNSPINDIGYLDENGELILDMEKINKWSRGVFSLVEDELYCPYGGIK